LKGNKLIYFNPSVVNGSGNEKEERKTSSSLPDEKAGKYSTHRQNVSENLVVGNFLDLEVREGNEKPPTHFQKQKSGFSATRTLPSLVRKSSTTRRGFSSAPSEKSVPQGSHRTLFTLRISIRKKNCS
jgi:hypothetical protein